MATHLSLCTCYFQVQQKFDRFNFDCIIEDCQNFLLSKFFTIKVYLRCINVINTYSVPVPDGSFMNTDNSVTTTAVMQRVMGIISDTICCAPHFNISRLLAVRSSSLISSESSSCSSKDGNRLRHFLNSHTIPHEVSSSEPWLRLLLGLLSVFLVSLKYQYW